VTVAIVNVADARALARRRLPRIFFDYIDGGAFGETTLQANRAAFGRWQLEQRVLVNHGSRDLSTTVLGQRQALPFLLGPVGFLGLYAGRGEIQAARAAHQAGIPLCLSAFSIASLSTLRRATPGPLQFQLYILKDRGLAEEMLAEARQVGVSTLYLTVDTAITSIRERDVRNGFRSLTRLTPGLLLRLAGHPRWCFDLLRAGPPEVGVIAHRPEFGRGVMAQAAHLSQGIDPLLSWRDVDWLRQRWPGRLVLKGILSAEDTRHARAAGVEGVVVSNHGGRQLDGAPATLSVLPEVVAAAEGAVEVLIDGGFRRGGDIIKALALGASGVLLGRAYTYGLAAAGEAGVSRVIAALAQEIDLSLALMGLPSIDALKQRGTAVLRPAG